MVRRRYYGSADNNNNEEEGEQQHLLLDTAYCDHYNNVDDDDIGSANNNNNNNNHHRIARTTGTGNNSKRNNINSRRRCCSPSPLMVIILILLLTIIAVCFSYMQLQQQLTTLSSQLQSATINISHLDMDLTLEQEQLHLMNDTLANHSKVISRFANSVSNSDVLAKLQELELESKEREERVVQEMNNTKQEIRGVLITTKREIDETVSNATNNINTQVLSVQSTLSSYIRTTQDQFSTENSFMVYQLAGTFTILGCLISMWHMTSHLRNFRQPVVQRKILAILWMCPIYSITSWLSLVLPQFEGYLAILKDMYEAYVIYQFLSFCISVLGKGDRNAVVEMLARHADHLTTPVPRWCMNCCVWWCCCCSSSTRWSHKKNTTTTTSTSGGGDAGDEEEEEKKQLADGVLLQCQICAMQFVFLRPLLTATLFILKKVNYHGPMFGRLDIHQLFHYGDGDNDLNDNFGEVEEEDGSGGGGMFDYRSPQFYIVILENVSVFLAFSGLLNFYHAVQDDLSWCRPFPKFLCIKGVVFMTFWQGIAISALATTTDLLSKGGEAMSTGDGDDEEQVETWAKQIQNFLICLEMLGFSIAHFYCFPVEEWEEGYRPVEDKSKFGDNMALGDFLHDLKHILRHNKRKQRMTKERYSLDPKSDDSISTVLEEDDEDEEALERTESNDDGLQSLLENFLENSGGDQGTSSAIIAKHRTNRLVSDKCQGSNSIMPRAAHRNRNILESLNASNAPVELRQATALLLQSSLLDESTARLLTSDILNQPLEGVSGTIDNETTSDEGEEVEHQKVETTNSDLEDPQQQSLEKDGGSCEEATTNNASTSLPPVTSVDEILRPSIFTMHSMSPSSDH